MKYRKTHGNRIFTQILKFFNIKKFHQKLQLNKLTKTEVFVSFVNT